MTDTQATYQPTEPLHFPLTLEAYLEAFDTQPAEVVHGELIRMAPVQFEHISLAHQLYDSRKPYTKQHQLGEVYMEAVYLLDADDRTNWVEDARIPDVSFIDTEVLAAHVKKYGKKGPLRLVPALAIEIVSPTDGFKAVLEKVQQYL